MNWTEHQNSTREHPTLFEELVHEVGLEKRPDLWRYNQKLRRFAKQNRRSRYIPESFLDQLGIDAGECDQ